MRKSILKKGELGYGHRWTPMDAGTEGQCYLLLWLKIMQTKENNQIKLSELDYSFTNIFDYFTTCLKSLST